ncbi:MAG TPA: exodeoxyribonuclease VII large subunit [Burkholderiales bacterium]|nr:exodeoxyribonuclease VII large subunit [Burkholderiales bacterium]
MPGEQGLARVSVPSPPEILTVSALARSVRDLLEHRFPLFWVAGEISNFTLARSGHAYFVLKDEYAQVRCVMFRQRHQYLDWQPRDGMQIEAQALVTLYEPRGDFQLNVESMRRAGLGALFEAFLRLRDKLEKEGLFKGETKRSLPAYPRTIGVITSLDAAALRDVLTTLNRRNPSVGVVVFPVPVQGEGAGERIAAALEVAGRRGGCDVLLLVRGGGSIEDLWAFNEEIVARAIRACPIPVVTGIGHESDFTIADFAADRRAPTPTAAAELVSPERTRLLDAISRLAARLAARARREIEGRTQHLDHLSRGLVHPGSRLRAQSELLAQLRLRLVQATGRIAPDRRGAVAQLLQRARTQLPDAEQLLATSLQLVARLRAAARTTLDRAASDCARQIANLSHLDPAAVLERGYSVVRDRSGRIVRRSTSVAPGDPLEVTFSEGGADVRVERSR